MDIETKQFLKGMGIVGTIVAVTCIIAKKVQGAPPPGALPGVINNINIKPDPCYSGDPLSVSITMSNPNSFEIRQRLQGALAKDGEIIKIDETIKLQPGINTLEWQMTTTGLEAGTYSLTLDGVSATFTLISKIERHLCPVCGQSFSSSEALKSHFLSHTTSVVNMLFKVTIWAGPGNWITIWENGHQLLVPTFNLGQVSRVGIVAYYWGGQQTVERLVFFPDGSVITGYTAGWQTRYTDGQQYSSTYSLPGFEANQPGVYYGKIKIRGTKIPDPVTGEYTYTDEINVILLKLLP